jgi:hypothetical protein
LAVSGWRIGDHRREIRLGGELAVDQRTTGELADRRAFLDELDVQRQEHSRLDRSTEFRPLDGHEIDQLARPGEAEGLDRENAGCLRQRSTPGMIGRSGKCPWKKPSLIVTAFVAVIDSLGMMRSTRSTSSIG